MNAGQSTGLAFGPARCPGQVGLHDVPLGTVFNLFGPLSSINSADASATSLFADVVGTMDSSARLASS